MNEAFNKVKLVIYKKIVSGDLRKFIAESNDALTGGGARDLRFSPAAEFMFAFKQLFPTDYDGRLSGYFSWIGHPDTAVDVFPPTKARPNELRISCVHECFPGNVIPTNSDDCVLLLILDNNNKVWPFFTSRYSLEHDDWHAIIKSSILKGLDATRSSKSTPMGYVDLVNGRIFTNGR